MLKTTLVCMLCAVACALGTTACEDASLDQERGPCGEDGCGDGVEASADPSGPSEAPEDAEDPGLRTGEGDEREEGEIVPRTDGPAGPNDGVATAFDVRITLSAQPIHNNFTRSITFENRGGGLKRVPIDFTKEANLVYSGSADAAGLTVLTSMNAQGNRWYWDKVSIENQGGTTALAIATIRVDVTYSNIGNSLNMEEVIPIVNGSLNQTLAAGNDTINLATPARAGRIAFAGKTTAQYNALPLQLRTAIMDLGKTGSDGSHGLADLWSDNPKYGAGTGALCSEFVSWYMFEAGETIGAFSFRDVDATMDVHSPYAYAGRLFCYNNVRKEWNKWRSIDGAWTYDTTVRYTPQPGDYLLRKPTATHDGHSMLLLAWLPDAANPNNNIARVVNGPWPVTLRDVEVHVEETTGADPKDFCVGQMYGY